MVAQVFNIYTAKGYAGDLPDSTSALVSQSVVAAVPLGFGIAANGDGTIVASGGYVHGITRRELNHEAANRPSDGTTNYIVGSSVSVLRQGYIYVEVTGRAAVAGALANVVDATGAFTGGSAGAGESASTNVVFQEAGIVGSVVKAWIEHQPV